MFGELVIKIPVPMSAAPAPPTAIAARGPTNGIDLENTIPAAAARRIARRRKDPRDRPTLFGLGLELRSLQPGIALGAFALELGLVFGLQSVNLRFQGGVFASQPQARRLAAGAGPWRRPTIAG